MPSKEARVYNWVLMIALENLVGEGALSFNHCIASDAEEVMFGPVRGIIHIVPYFKKIYHYLDKFHLLTKKWKDNVNNKITGDKPKKCWYTAVYVRRYVPLSKTR